MSQTIAARATSLLDRLGVPADAYVGGSLASCTPITGEEVARLKVDSLASTEAAIARARANRNTTVIYIRNDRYQGVAGYESWWDVPPAEVSDSPSVQAKRREWAEMRATERDYL